MVDSTPRPSDLRLAEAVAFVYGFAPSDEQPRPSDIRAARAIAQALLNAGIGSGGGGGGSPASTDALPEGFNNLYFTNQRAQDALSATLQSYAPISHTQPISTITGLQNALDGKTPYGHGHGISDVSGLQNALNAKAASVHTHAASEVSTDIPQLEEGTNVNDALSSVFNAIPDNTSELPEETNLYYTNARADARADIRITAQKGNADGLVPLRSDRTISSEYITLTVNTLVALSGVPKPVNGSKVAYIVRGFYSEGDGGGGVFYWDESDTTTAADNGLIFLVNNNSVNGRWKRVFEGEYVNAAWWGLKTGIGITNAAANSNAIQRAINSDYNVYIPAGNYTINLGLRCSAGYFNSIGKSPYHGWGKQITGGGRSRCRLYCWTGNVPAIDFSGSSNVVFENIELVNANTVSQGTAEGSSNASAIGIAICRDTLTTFNHYCNFKNVIVAFGYQDNSTQLGGVGTIGMFGLGCEHIYLENCHFYANICCVFTRVYSPTYFAYKAGINNWNIRNYLPNHSGEVASSCLIGRSVDCVFVNNGFRHPALILDRCGAWTFTNAYMSNRGGGTAGTYQYLIYNVDASDITFQGMAECAGMVGSNYFRRTGFMENTFPIKGWKVDYLMTYGIENPSTFTANVPYLRLDFNGTNLSGMTGCEFKIHTGVSETTDLTGHPVAPSANVTNANSFNVPIQNCTFYMDTQGATSDILADFMRIRNVRCYEMRSTTFFASRSWEDYGVWAYGRVSNTGVRDGNATSPRCPSSSLTTTTYRVNYSQALTFAYLAINLTIEGATANLCPVITNRQPTYFEYQVFNTTNVAVTTGFTQVNFMITQVSADNSFS